jgi:hypothetical protein
MKVKTHLKAGDNEKCDHYFRALCNCGMNDPQVKERYPLLAAVCETYLDL